MGSKAYFLLRVSDSGSTLRLEESIDMLAMDFAASSAGFSILDGEDHESRESG